jgi:HEAT repeat protein
MTSGPAPRSVRRRRRPRIARLERKRKVDALIDALGYTDRVTNRDGRSIDSGASVRRDAVLALGKLGDQRGIQAIAATGLHDQDDDVRQTALRSLVGHPDAGTVAALVQLAAEGPDQGARELAVSVIRGAGSSTAAADVALQLVARSGEGPLGDNDVRIVELVTGGGGDHRATDAVVSALIAGGELEDGDARQRRIQLLAAFPDSSVDMLIATLADQVRQTFAAEALGALKDIRAFEPLLELLRAEDAAARQAAAVALGELRDPRGAEALFAATRDEEYGVRLSASQALDQMGSVAIMMGLGAPSSSIHLPELQSVAGEVGEPRELLEGQPLELPASDAPGELVPRPAGSDGGGTRDDQSPQVLRRLVSKLLQRYL